MTPGKMAYRILLSHVCWRDTQEEGDKFDPAENKSLVLKWIYSSILFENSYIFSLSGLFAVSENTSDTQSTTILKSLNAFGLHLCHTPFRHQCLVVVIDIHSKSTEKNLITMLVLHLELCTERIEVFHKMRNSNFVSTNGFYKTIAL